MGERRPLSSRDSAWAKATASWLARRRVPPNAISILSVVFAACAAAAFIGSAYLWGVGRLVVLVAAAVFIQLRLICNLLDGMVAVEGKMGSKSGEIFNDVPDRVADPLILVAAGYAIPFAWGSALGWLAGVLAVMTAYIRVLGGATGAGQDFGGPMAKPHRMAVMTIAALAEAFASPFAGRGLLLALALGAVAIGSAVTAIRRTVRMRRILESR